MPSWAALIFTSVPVKISVTLHVSFPSKCSWRVRALTASKKVNLCKFSVPSFFPLDSFSPPTTWNSRCYVLFRVLPNVWFSLVALKKIKVHFPILNPCVSGHNRRIHELLCRSQRFNRHGCLFYRHDEECLETLIIWLKKQDFTSTFCRFPWLHVCTTPHSFSIITASSSCANYSQSAGIIPRCFGRLSLRGLEHNQRADLACGHSADLSFFSLHPWHVLPFLR